MELVVLLHLFHLFRTLSSPSLPHVPPLCFTILHHHHHLLLLVTFHPFTMETKSFVDGKRTFIEDDIDDEYLDDEEGGGEMVSFAENEKKRAAGAPLTGKRGSIAGSGGGVSPPRCQAEKCAADLTDAKRYHRRHKVCEFHSKAAAVVVAGQRQRFCQQCSRFHELSEFDEAKRSCRRRLAGHNERRRKVGSAESSGEVSGRRGVRQADDQRGRIHVTIPGNSGYNKHLQIR